MRVRTTFFVEDWEREGGGELDEGIEGNGIGSGNGWNLGSGGEVERRGRRLVFGGRALCAIRHHHSSNRGEEERKETTGKCGDLGELA
jgi:hypothetical protein